MKVYGFIIFPLTSLTYGSAEPNFSPINAQLFYLLFDSDFRKLISHFQVFAVYYGIFSDL